ncbi:hypothetical protein K8I85_01560 [bacterium]|nr:hypothetical protein [bacterium]
MDRRLFPWILPLLVLVALSGPAAADQVVVASTSLYEVDTDAGTVRVVADLGRFVKDLSIDAAGRTAYAATSGGILRVDLATGETSRVFGDGPARSVELDETGGHVHGMFTMGEGKAAELRTFSLESGERLHVSTLPATTRFLSWSGTEVVGLEHGARALHRYEGVAAVDRVEASLPPRVTKKTGTSTLYPEVFAHEASGLLVIPEVGIEAGIWVMRPGQGAEWIALGHEAHARGGVVSADGRYVYLSALDHVSKVDLVEKREVAWIGLDVVHQRIALSEDGRELFLTVPVDGAEGALSVLSASTLEPVRRIPIRNASPFVLAVVP